MTQKEAEQFLKDFLMKWQDKEYYYDNPDNCIKAWATRMRKKFKNS